MLAEDGSYWVLLNVQGDRMPEFEAEAALRLRAWIKHVLDRDVDLTGCIKVKDATFLANVFNERPFVLSAELSRMLELDEPDFFSSWDQWSAALPDRRKLSFEVDDERQGLIDALDQVLRAPAAADPAQRVFRVAGAPGVGKTRLVHHVLEQPRHTHLHARVRYTKDAQEARKWLEREGLAKSPDLVLVLDEVPPDGANELWRSFERSARSAGQARLILVGPRDDADVAKPEPTILRPFESEQHRRALVEHDLEQAGEITEALIGVITGLSEGYPLFSMWLTRALAKDPTLLDDPGSELTDGQDPWRAAAAVLAGPRSEHGGDERTWWAEAELRARAVLLVVLVPDNPWELLPADQRTLLVDALDVGSWSELKRAAAFCKDRGLLRDEPAGHHYISPANLERLVLDHLFGAPSGPEPERLREVSPAGFERLLLRVARVRASQACRQRLAKAVWISIDEAVDRLGPGLSRLVELVAEVDPEQTSFVVDRLVERLGAARIADDNGLVGPIREALEHLRHRRISARAFEAVERALFSLAVEKQEPWGNNARAVWASLFQAVLHQTHQSFEERLVLLRRRLASTEPRMRQVALEGLLRLILGDSGRFRPGVDDVDGEWELPTNREIVDRQRMGWQLLAEVAEDPDPGVRGTARGMLAEHLWSGLSTSSIGDVLDALPEHAGQWTPMERYILRDAVEWVLETHNHGEQSQRADMFERLADLRSALRPTDLQERLLAQVGRGRPAQLSLATTARMKQEQDDDRALARDLLREPDILMANLDWLTSEQAGRSRVFAHALGFEDGEHGLLSRLVAVRDEHPADSLIVSYLCGRSDSEGSTAIDPWLSEQSVDPSMAKIIARTIVAIGGSDTRARLLTVLVAQGGLDKRALLGLGFWSWHEGVSLPVLDTLIAELACRPEEFCRIEALGLTARRLERTPASVAPPLTELAHALLRTTSSDELSAVAERDWIAVAIGLYERGDAAVMHVVLSIVVEQKGYLGHARKVLDQWLRDDAAVLWSVVVDGFSRLEDPRASILAHVATRLRLVERVPHDDVLRWVGDDAERAQMVALWSAPHDDELGLVARGLLVGFGAQSDVARMLFASAISSPGRASFEGFEHEQLQRATRWASDPEPEVAQWAARVRDHLIARADIGRRGYA
jgi:hypothetical protein